MFYIRRVQFSRLRRSISTAADKGPRVTICNENRLFDEPIDISIDGLPAGKDVSVYASLRVSSNTIYDSLARYRVSSSGCLDLSKHASIGGSYSGIEPTGLFWSMEPYSTNQKRPIRFPNSTIDTPVYDLGVYEGHQHEIIHLRSSESNDANQLLRFSVRRPYADHGVKRISVREDGLVGTLFLPDGEGPHPGVIVLFGGYPGIREYKGALLASRGFASLVLAHYGIENLPTLMEPVDLSYFQRAIRFMRRIPSIKTQNGIGVIGLCKGASISLAMATYFPEIRCVVWLNSPPCQIFGNLKYGSKIFPEAQLIRPQTKGVDGKIALKNFFKLPSAKEFSNLPGYYPFEKRHDVSYLLIAGMDDQCVPASYAAEVAEWQLANSGHPDYEIIHYPGAGHVMEPPNFPLCGHVYQPEFNGVLSFGGQQPLHHRAEKDSWRCQLEFLSAKLN